MTNIKNFPFKKEKTKIPLIKKKIINNNQPKEETKLKEPILLLIRGNYDVEILENINEGQIEITKKNGKKVNILIPKSKILSFKWGDDKLKGWIVDEHEAVALPTNTMHDSEELARIFKGLSINYKDYETSNKQQGWATMILYLFIGIAIILVVSSLFGIDLPFLSQPEETIKYVEIAKENIYDTPTPK